MVTRNKWTMELNTMEIETTFQAVIKPISIILRILRRIKKLNSTLQAIWAFLLIFQISTTQVMMWLANFIHRRTRIIQKLITTEEKPKKKFNPDNLKKLHLQMKHGSRSAMKEFIQSARQWNDNLNHNITELLKECNCVQAGTLVPHAVVSSNPPPSEE